MKIRNHDNVIILKGKDRGKTGKIEHVIPKSGMVIVSGVNVCKKHLKPNQKNPHGGIVDFNAPLKISNVAVICPRCSKVTRIKFQKTKKNKYRICQHCQESIDSK